MSSSVPMDVDFPFIYVREARGAPIGDLRGLSYDIFVYDNYLHGTQIAGPGSGFGRHFDVDGCFNFQAFRNQHRGTQPNQPDNANPLATVRGERERMPGALPDHGERGAKHPLGSANGLAQPLERSLFDQRQLRQLLERHEVHEDQSHQLALSHRQ